MATAIGDGKCKSSERRKYEQRVTVMVRSVEYGPFCQSNKVVVCNLG